MSISELKLPENKMNDVYLSLGSNLGDKRSNLKKALELLSQHESIIICERSSYYETAPRDYIFQDDFINQAVKIKTALTPFELLNYCQDIEKKLLRKKTVTYGPRTIDIDILLFEGWESSDPKLTVPHPRMTERAFVLIPLAEINSQLIIFDKSISDHISLLRDKNQKVTKIPDK